MDFGMTSCPTRPTSASSSCSSSRSGSGFDYGWTYDSHVLWQESMPTLALAAQATERIKLGHMVTNPGTREPTVLASAYATLQDISDGRMVMGDRPRRLRAALHRPGARCRSPASRRRWG